MKAAQYLAQAVEACRNALQVRTHEQLPQDWAGTQNNLGNALRALGERSEGEKAREYLAQAVNACHQALQVRTEVDLPVQWTTTMVNLALAYELQGNRTSAVETYRQLLRHYPDEQDSNKR